MTKKDFIIFILYTIFCFFAGGIVGVSSEENTLELEIKNNECIMLNNILYKAERYNK